MASRNSTTPSTADNSTDTGNQQRNSRSLSPATYYGAIIVVVFLLIVMAIVGRIVYSRKHKNRNPAIDEPAVESREREERLAMDRRGEESGLPTYRESILLPNNDTVLAATPMSDAPYINRPSTSDTLPNPVTSSPTVLSGDLPPSETVEPPKYEVDPTDQVADLTTFPPTTHEMRLSSHSTCSTLILPSISINEAPEEPPPSNSSQPHQPSTTLMPPSVSSAQPNT